MPINDDERVGFKELSMILVIDETTIPMPFRQNIIDELAKPRAERGPGFPGQAWKATVPPGFAEAHAAIQRRSRGQIEGYKPVTYLYRPATNDVMANGRPVTIPESEMLQTVNGGLIPAGVHDFTFNLIDYRGPYTATDALAEVV
jgi:hypothetical protein